MVSRNRSRYRKQKKKTSIINGNLDSLVLRTNFRSASQVIDWVNDTFSAVFPKQDDCDRGAIRYAPAEAFRNPAPNGGVQVHPLFGGGDNQESRLVVDLILDAKSAGHERIAVLARSRTHECRHHDYRVF